MPSAWTKFADLFNPEVATQMIMQRALSSSRIFNSGAVVALPQFQLAPGNRKVIVPFWNQPDEDSQILDENTDLEVRALTGDEMTAVVNARALVYGATDLQKLYTGEDPVAAVFAGIGGHWGRDFDKMAAAVLSGFFAADTSGASMEGAIIDITDESGAAAFIDADASIDATGLMGEDQDTALAFAMMHPDTYTYAKKLDLVETVAQSDGGDPIVTYQGKSVILTRRAPKVEISPVPSGAKAYEYTTIFCGRGALGYAETPHPEGQTELNREALKGGGRSALISRRVNTIHPIGGSWVPQSGVPVKQHPSNAELADGGNWERTFELENVRMVAVKHLLPA